MQGTSLFLVVHEKNALCLTQSTQLLSHAQDVRPMRKARMLMMGMQIALPLILVFNSLAQSPV